MLLAATLNVLKVLILGEEQYLGAVSGVQSGMDWPRAAAEGLGVGVSWAR